MEQGQVVQVRGAGFGSGYLIAPRLVLTAAHNLPPTGDEITVALRGSQRESAAEERWRSDDAPDDILDAALLEIPADDQNWQPPATLREHPQRWGRFVTAGTPIPVAAMGFPRQQREDDRRPEELLTGQVRTRSGTTFEILDAHGTLSYDVVSADTTPWSGMSGAAVFGEGDKLLLGVVHADRRPGHGTRLRCTSSEALLARDDFRAAVYAASGVEPQPEPAELAGLLEPAPPIRALTSPTMLLRADAEVVPFHGRRRTLDFLEQWCLADRPASPVRVLTGPGGQGKTRLARQLMAHMRDHGWVAGEVRGRPDQSVLDRVLRPIQHPLLLVVDYAETRPALVRDLQAATERATHPVRLLLLARSAGTWQNTVTDADETRLQALRPDDDTERAAADREAARAAAYRETVHALADRLPEATGRTDVDWRRLAEALPTPATATAETALTVQMSALVALLRHVQDPERNQPLEAQLLAHERKYWRDNASGRGIGERAARLLEPAVAAAVLCPARDKDEALAAVAAALPHEQMWMVSEIAEVLRDLYPPPEDRWWGQLEPDRLAEYHAADQVIDDAGLLGRLFAQAPDHQRVQTLTVLARAAVAHANEDRPAKARTIVDRLRETLRSVPADRPLTVAVLRAHTDALPEQSHVLRDYALDVARELARLSRETGALRDHAWALHNLAGRHLAVGDRTAGRAAADEATKLRARLTDEPGLTDVEVIARNAEWAESLLVLSRACRMTGQLPQAYAAGNSALSLFLDLTPRGGPDREKREHGLVRALINLSNVVWQLDPTAIDFDQVARSDDYTDEAVRRARDLAERHPDLDPHLLTDALGQRSANLWRFQHTESLAASEEAATTARRLADENPDAHAADLANALLSLAVDHIDNPRSTGEATAMMREAIDLLRPLAADLPEVHRADLSQLLHNLACDQRDEKHYPAARESIEEAIELRRAMDRDSYGTATPLLAQSVWILGTIHAGEGHHEAAVRRLIEALDIYAHARLPLSADALSKQASAALELASSYEALGRATDAFAAQNQALAIRRRLSEYAPDLYTKWYAFALHDQSGLFRRYEQPIAERIRLRQALPRYRRLSHLGAEGREWLAYCLHDLGASYATSPATAERAIAPLREAYELRAALAAADATLEVNLSATCSQLTRALAMTNRFAESARIAEHAVRIQRRLAAADPAEAQWLCVALLRLAEGQTMTGHTAAAWQTVREAEEICLAAADRPGLRQDEIANMLRRLARAISLCGRHDPRLAARAVAPAQRAARIYRGLADAPGTYVGRHLDLRKAVTTLAWVLERVGRHADAVDAQRRRGA